MRIDRLTSLKQRLRRGADAFEFSALIQGVSTLDEPAAPIDLAEALRPIDTSNTPVEIAPALSPLGLDDPQAAQISPLIESGTLLIQESNGAQTVLPLAEVEPHTFSPAGDPHAERLSTALLALSGRLLREVNRFGGAISSGCVQEAGAHLAQVNQLLELLNSVDATGDVSRQLGTPGAPPLGRAWPSPAWSLAEFAESPLSALLPSRADEELVRSLMYAAWGVTFDA